MEICIAYSNVTKLAARLGRRINFFDLGCTTGRGTPDFGIMDVGCFVVPPAGSGLTYGSLINPALPISEAATEKTGIVAEMVIDQELWNMRYAAHFHDMASTVWLAGFNISTFDLHGIKDENARYGMPIEEFKFTFDVRSLHLKLSKATSDKGTLEDIAKVYGVARVPAFERAQANAIIALEITDRIVATYGLDAVVGVITAKSTAGALTAENIALFAEGKTSVSMHEIASVFATEEKKIGFELGRAIDTCLVNPAVFAVAGTQEWLQDAFMDVPGAVLTGGKLKPLYDCLLPHKPSDVEFDYVQLRIGLANAGMTWSSLKKA